MATITWLARCQPPPPLVNGSDDLEEKKPQAQKKNSSRAQHCFQRASGDIFVAFQEDLHLLRERLLFTDHMMLPPTPGGQRHRLVVRYSATFKLMFPTT